MRRVILLFPLFALLFSASATSADIVVGSRAMVPTQRFVGVMNRHPVRSLDNEFERGEGCAIENSGKIRVKRIEGAGRLRVRYIAPRPARGAECPTGIIFTIDRKSFRAMTPEYRKTDRRKILKALAETP